jgi:hypothetical protein
VRVTVARPAIWVFLILLGSYAFFWHSRDWNTASRLMLTYAIVDRGTVAITGLDRQTNDKAYYHGEYYSDKLPGFSFLAALPYAVARWVFRLPSHPLNVPAFAFWSADYWATLCTSGLATAAIGSILVLWAQELGCRPGRAAIVGLAYGLATPAYVYATLAYGHQVSAFALFTSFFLVWRRQRRRDALGLLLAGFLAAYAAVIELQVGPVSAILGLYLLAQCLRGNRHPDALSLFAIGAVIPTLMLLAYNQLAFGSPFEMGYFHHATKQFADVHNPDNPLGLKIPAQFGRTLLALLWGRYRGLTFYAPILLLTVPGWIVLFCRRCWDLAIVTLLVVVAVVLVNLFYPEWTGGWSTGPRLLLPSIPFAMLPVAALLVRESRLARVAMIAAMVLALIGGIEMLLFQGAGGRIPFAVNDPLVEFVWPHWIGRAPILDRNLVAVAAPDLCSRKLGGWQAVQFLPLVLMQALVLMVLRRLINSRIPNNP